MLLYLKIAGADYHGPLGVLDIWIHQYPLLTRLEWCALAGLV